MAKDISEGIVVNINGRIRELEEICNILRSRCCETAAQRDNLKMLLEASDRNLKTAEARVAQLEAEKNAEKAAAE